MKKVSIHAPARGATHFVQNDATPRCFNPRARAGRDEGTLCPACYLKSFNPRARAGRDLNDQVQAGRFMFQSTRPRGARLLR